MEKKPFPSETQERFIVRLPDGMRDRIAEAAKAAGRSMNSEIVHRLQESFDERFLAVIEAKATSGPESKRFEFNAEEIAQKVIEKLEGRGKSEESKQLQPHTLELIKRVEGPLGPIQESYLEYVRHVLEGRMGLPDAVAHKVILNKGPTRSANARKANISPGPKGKK